MSNKNLRLSICIATYNRGKFIAETLDSIQNQMRPEVELIVVEGASPDNTHEVMEQYVSRYPNIRYYRETVNSGVDGDYDKAVGYARGEYCWLMTDDDLVQPGAIDRILAELSGKRDLVIVNAEVRNADLSVVLATRQFDSATDKSYGDGDAENFFAECMNYLSFIGGVVIRRNTWLERERKSYYGSLFIHVGVICQHPPIENIFVISEPYIIIRYGNALWTSRGFEIRSFKWPEFVWSFNSFSDSVKRRVCHPAPWKRIRTLFYERASGAYSKDEFNQFISPRTSGLQRAMAHGIAIFPGKLSNIISVFYFMVLNRSARMMQFDLLRSRHASKVSRWLARVLWV